jgi:predicted DsbA family dithiol-disulfide isomerase
VQIEIWSDFACPWCALGIYRLDAARAQFEHGDEITVTHRAFELDPRAPARRPQSMAEVLAAKYGMNPEQVRVGHERLTSLGNEVGMVFDFERIQLGNTFDAHRLAGSARGTATEDALVKRLFAAYFTDGKLLSDHQVLCDAAAEAGLDPAAARAVLESDAFAAEVRADEEAARELDITGVPHFAINGKWAVPGAQDVETLLIVLRRAWERTEVTAT